MPLREQLQASLRPAYIIERELGGGGMSRVYLAEETAFGRRVVVKLLSPELVAGVNVERFKREIQMALGSSIRTSSRSSPPAIATHAEYSRDRWKDRL